MWRRGLGSIVGAALVAGAAGCGGGSGRPASAAAEAGSVAVIRAWSQALTRGDLRAAGAYFAIPSSVQIDFTQPLATVRSAAEARIDNRMLPCGAVLLDAHPVDRYIDALFRLTSRPGAACDGPGGTARVAFVIRSGKIAVWRRIQDEPGDAARAAPGQPNLVPPAARSV